MTSDLLDRFPSIYQLGLVAKKRIPHFAWEHLDSGTGEEATLALNRAAFNAIRLVPQYLSGGGVTPSLTTRFFGQDCAAPFGIAPVGVTGLLWPGGEQMLAGTAARHGIPYCLSAVACETPESVGPITQGRGCFQLYPPKKRAIRDDLIRRAQESGFIALIVTIDVPTYGMRERPRRAGLRMPPGMSLNTLVQIAVRPVWTIATLLHGAPRFRTIETYGNADRTKAAHIVLHELNETVDETYLKEVRDQWKGPLILKGILHPEDARRAVGFGVDGIIVSNHGGRQFDAAPASIQALPGIVDAVGGKTSILLDSGVRTGLDILRAIALGADFVLLGRAFLYGIAALGEKGGDHVARLLKEDISNNMKQVGVGSLEALRPARDDFGFHSGCLLR